eukprot:6629422-Prymnesium_polylepis.1
MRVVRTAFVVAISLLALSAVRTGVFLTYSPSSSDVSSAGPAVAAPEDPNLRRPPRSEEQPAVRPFVAAPPPAPPRADGSVEAALRMAAPQGNGGLVVLTFGNAKVAGVLQ